MLEITACMLISKDQLHNAEQREQFMSKGQKMQYILEDQPSRTLLKYMKNFDYVAPESWEGCRALTAK